jgi:hypothetical protein
MKLPHVVSAVNGMKIPLPPHHAGIMHRFTQPENRLVISQVNENGARPDTETRLTVAPTADPAAAVADAAPTGGVFEPDAARVAPPAAGFTI